MAADNSAYDYFLQNNPHKPENNKPVSNAEKRIPAKNRKQYVYLTSL